MITKDVAQSVVFGNVVIHYRVNASHQHVDNRHNRIRWAHSMHENLFEDARIVLGISRTLLDDFYSPVDVLDGSSEG